MHDAFLWYAIAATYCRVVGVGLADPVTDRFCDRWINVCGVQCNVWRSHASWQKLFHPNSAPEMISEGLKSQMFLVSMPPEQ